jgi:CRISPR system Cascade subunit CasE
MLVSYYSEAMEYKPEFGEGDLMKFRISINLSKKSNEYCKSGEIRQKSGKEQSKRVALTWEKEKDRDTEILAWFNNKAIHNGFKVNDLQVVNVGWKYLWKNQEKLKTLKFRSALLEGRLTVTDRYVMLNTIQSGLGSAKAFGFGLLSVKKLNF